MNVKDINLLQDYIIFKPLTERTENIKGLVMPRESSRIKKGLVLRAGPGKDLHTERFLPMMVNPGDVILYNSIAEVNEVNTDEEQLSLITLPDVIAVIKQEEK